MSLLWKRPRRPAPEVVEQIFEDLDERLQARSADTAAGALEMLAHRDHPLVRAAMISTRRRRAVLSACLAIPPLLVFAAAVLLRAGFSLSPLAAWLAESKSAVKMQGPFIARILF